MHPLALDLRGLTRRFSRAPMHTCEITHVINKIGGLRGELSFDRTQSNARTAGTEDCPAQLVLPIREHKDKKLKFADRVGTGFSDKLLRSLYSELEKIRIDSCPFFNLPAAGRSRLDPDLTATEMN